MVSSTLIQNSICKTRKGGEANGESGSGRHGEGRREEGLTEQQPWRRQTPRGGSRTEHRSSRHRQQHEHRPISDRILARCSARLLCEFGEWGTAAAISSLRAEGTGMKFTVARRGTGLSPASWGGQRMIASRVRSRCDLTMEL